MIDLFKKKKDQVVSRDEKGEFPYMYMTSQGYEILRWGMDKNGILTVIARKPGPFDRPEYVVCNGYSARTGTWNWGHYMASFDSAVKDYESQHLKYDFDPADPVAVDFMRYGSFNFNNIDSGYLAKHDYREPGFDTYPSFTYYDTDRYSTLPPREEFESFRDEYVRAHANFNRKADDVQIRIGNRIVDIPSACDDDLRRFFSWFCTNAGGSYDDAEEEVEMILDDHKVGPSISSFDVTDYYLGLYGGACSRP